MDKRTPVVHELKTLAHYFNDVESRKKNFEVRLNDRDYQVGDILYLRERSFQNPGWDYTGRTCTRIVKYILDEPQYVKENYIIMGLE
jgi:hypothetical protein